MRHACLDQLVLYRHAREGTTTTIQETEAGRSIVMLIVIIIIHRVRDEAELGDRMLGRKPWINTAVEAAPRTPPLTTTPTPKRRTSVPLDPSSWINHFLNLTPALPDHLTGTSSIGRV